MLKYASHLIWVTAFIVSPIDITDITSNRGKTALQGAALAQQSDVDIASLQRDLEKLRSLQETENRRAAEIAVKRKAEEKPLLESWLKVERKEEEVARVLAGAKADVTTTPSANTDAALKIERERIRLERKRIQQEWAALRRRTAQEKQEAEKATAQRKAQVERILAALQQARRKNVQAKKNVPAKKEETTEFTFSVPTSAPVRLAQETQQIIDSLSRARKLFEDGRINEGRLFLEHAADAGSADGAFKLAESYDPIVQQNQRAVGVVPNKTLAVKWYRRAGKLGANDTEKRIKRLGTR